MQSLIASVIASPLVATAISTCKLNGRLVPCDQIWNTIMPIFGYVFALALIVAVIMIISLWKIFQKAGKPGWASIVPIYNMVVLFQILGLNPWLILLFFIPFVNAIAGIIFKIVISYRLALVFNRGTGFAVGLFFLPFIFYPMLAFSNDQYHPFVGSMGGNVPPTSLSNPTTPIV